MTSKAVGKGEQRDAKRKKTHHPSENMIELDIVSSDEESWCHVIACYAKGVHYVSLINMCSEETLKAGEEVMLEDLMFPANLNFVDGCWDHAKIPEQVQVGAL